MRIYKQNTNTEHMFDDSVIVRQNATAADFRELEQKAKTRGIFERSGIDKQNHGFFTSKTGYRLTLVD